MGAKRAGEAFLINNPPGREVCAWFHARGDAVPTLSPRSALFLRTTSGPSSSASQWEARPLPGGSRRPTTGEPVGALPTEGRGLVPVRCGERAGAALWAGARASTLFLGFFLVGPGLAELHGGEHAPPGSVSGADRMRGREMDARRKMRKHRRAKPERTRKRGSSIPRPSPAGPEIRWATDFPSWEP